MPSTTSAKIRMYRLNELGDCFLVTFTAGEVRSHLLIDCGSFRNSKNSKERLTEIAAQIMADVGGGCLDVVIGTHQHNDHLSGFFHCESAFKTIGVGQVWLSWLDDPNDAQARRIGKEHKNLSLSLSEVLHAMKSGGAKLRDRPQAARSLALMRDAMGFFGADGTGGASIVPSQAVDVLKSIGKQKPKYLEPGQTLNMPGLPSNTVRVHVLGPPKHETSLLRKDPRIGESYDPKLTLASRLAGQVLRAAKTHAGLSWDAQEPYPFASRFKCGSAGTPSPALKATMRRYARKDRWRSVDDAWMQTAAGLALYLDDFTNNSSLVVAIELVESGKVLLFAADAQAGNWASWKDIKWGNDHPGTDDLLERTVFYKVGHHGSHNATLVEAFEKVGGDDLCALIPVHKKDPNITKPNGWRMPAKKLFKRLVERTEGRVLQMDGVNPTACNPTKAAKAAWKRIAVTPKQTKNAIEVEIR